MNHTYRYYQEEADKAIYEELLINNKCIVKMFCGTGKSLLMRKCRIIKSKKLVVYVFPSLSLIDQFYTDYLHDFKNILKISSETESTTDAIKITKFLSKKINKIICITYQSFKTLLDNLGKTIIDVCIFDEAHHAVGETYQKLIFDNDTSICDKQIFFTATPKNANGIVMYDRDNLEACMCGKLVYDYSYLRGMNEHYLQPFEIRVDMYTDNTNKSVYESIARATLVSGNNRVLTFHSDVNTERDTSVNNFVNEKEFITAFKKVQETEFPENKIHKKISMIGLSSSIGLKERRIILDKFDASPDNEIIVISSCETIGEGIDTKNANMCVFVDPKSSYVKIIQNIGRIVRKQFGQSKPNSTILIPCWVDKTKYLECGGDREKCDEVIRQDMSEGGNFNGILNVLSALKQEDEDIYDICLHYPDTYSPQEIKSNLEKQGYTIDDQVGEGTLMETLEHLLDTEIYYEEYEYCDTDEEMIMNIADQNDVCIEIHTNSFENPVERYNPECEEIIRLYKCENEFSEEEDQETIYQPIIKKDKQGSKKNTGLITNLKRENRMNFKVHTNPDIKVLWNISRDFDITKDICSCVIDCEVIKYDPMEVAIGIVERANKRVENKLNLIPRNIFNKEKRNTQELEQENKDATKLSYWKLVLKGKIKGICSDEVRDYLDNNLKDWRKEQDFDKKAMEDAKAIVERAKERENNGLYLLPRKIGNKKNRNTPELEQENKDVRKLGRWKQALKGQGRSICSDEVRDYLDNNLKDWRNDLDEKAMEDAKAIVERANKRVENKLNLLPRQIQNKNRNTPELEQEYKDAVKLGHWKQALKGKGYNCSDKVRDYLDNNLKDWRKEQDFDEKAMEDAKAIVERANKRVENKLNLLPRKIGNKKNRNTPELEQENKDAVKLGDWKQALKGKGSCICFDEVRDYLDLNLKHWRKEQDFDKKAMEHAKAIVERANKRVENKLNLLPRNIHNKKNRNTPELEQENKDAQKLNNWKIALKGQGSCICFDEVRDYLDNNLKGWRSIDDNSVTQSVVSSSIKEDEKKLIIIPTPKKSMKLKKPSTKKQETETQEQKRERVKSEISVLHQRYKTMNSKNLHQEFNNNPDIWHNYHQISEENEKSFPDDDIPRNRIIQELNKIKTKRTKQVVDMGCGKAQIAEYFQTDNRFKFINYDHISSNDTIISCDISNTPLEDDSVEICILSLAMWGSNCREYIQEANRILESGGKLYVVEPTKRWSEQDEQGNIIAEKEGSKMKTLLEENGFKIVEQSIEKFCLFVGIKI
jgi:ribosomal RNA-processing protein 8